MYHSDLQILFQIHLMSEQLIQLLITHGYEVEVVVGEEHEDEALKVPASNENDFSLDFLGDTDDLSELDQYLSDSHSQNCHVDNIMEFEEFSSDPHCRAKNQESSIDDVLNFLREQNDLLSAHLTEKKSFQLGQNKVNTTIASSQQEAGPGKVENLNSLWEDMAMSRDEFGNFLSLPNISHEALTPESVEIETPFPEENDHQIEKKSFQFGIEKLNTETSSTITPTRKQDQDSGEVNVKNKVKKRPRVESKIGGRPMGRPSKARKALEEYQDKVKQCRLELAEMVEDQVKTYLSNDDYTEQDILDTIVAETVSLPHFFP